MARTCTICGDSKRAEIDAALIQNEAYRSVAKRFNVSAPAVFRHQSEHLPAQMVKEKEVSEVAEASALVKELRELTRKTAAILTPAMRQKDGDLALKAVGRLERQLELKARLLGQLEERGSGGATVVQVVYVDAKMTAGTQKTPHSLGRGKVIDVKTQDKSTSNPLLDDQNHGRNPQDPTEKKIK